MSPVAFPASWASALASSIWVPTSAARARRVVSRWDAEAAVALAAAMSVAPCLLVVSSLLVASAISVVAVAALVLRWRWEAAREARWDLAVCDAAAVEASAVAMATASSWSCE